MPEPLLGNESGNWNPSDLFGTVIILLRLDFHHTVQCQRWVPPLWSFLHFYFVWCFQFLHCCPPWEFWMGQSWRFVSIFIQCFGGLLFLFYALNYALWNLFGCSKIITIDACYETSVLLDFTLCPGGTVFIIDILYFTGKHTVEEDN